MRKKEFIKLSGLLTGGLLLSPQWACKTIQSAAKSDKILSQSGEFLCPPLPYSFAAMEPHIDAKTMEIHHDKHHNTYVSKLNEAVKGSIFQGKSLGYIFENISPDAGHSAFRNHGGGHYNHSLFWTILTPRRDMQPSGKLLEAIIAHWGSVEKLFVELKDVGLKTFGSGWVWLCVAPDKSLFTMQTPNQDNPLMIKVAARTGIPILGIDVWEHAYYLQYQNKRGEYLEGVMRLLNWEEIGRRYLEALGA